MKRTEKNELLARFWGYRRYEELQEISPEDNFYKGKYYVPETPDGHITQHSCFETDQFRFDTSYDWLMATVRKIERMFNYNLQITTSGDRHYVEFRIGTGPVAVVFASASTEQKDELVDYRRKALFEALVDCVEKINKKLAPKSEAM